MNQNERINKLRIYAQENNGRLFRNNVGEAWIGIEQWIYKGIHKIIQLSSPRRIKFGLHKGSSDLIGWKTILITPEMIGKRFAIFWAMEEKYNNDKLKPDQINFLKNVKNAGGIANIAHNKNGNLEIKELD